MKNIFIGESLYALLIFLLLKKESETFFFLGENISVKGIKNKKILRSFRFKNRFFRFFEIYFEERYLECFCKKNGLADLPVFGADHLGHSNYFKKKHKLYVIEDGISNYEKHNYKKKLEKLKKKIGLIPSYGNNLNTQKIYLTGLAPIPKEIKDKVEIISLRELWDKKSEEEKNEVLEIFDIKDFFENRNLSEKTIFLTQPFSEERVMSEEEEMKLYRELFKNYDENNLIIKTHPREKKDYKKYFSNIEVLDKSFPFELFRLMDIKFKRVGTIFSTAALDLGKDVPVDFYGTKIHPKIMEKCGEITIENLKK